MSDELECFRRAAELGCTDFVLLKHDHGIDVFFYLIEAVQSESCLQAELPSTNEFIGKRLNRYAAAVCAEWWYRQTLEHGHKGFGVWNHCNRMMEEARSFGLKYGV